MSKLGAVRTLMSEALRIVNDADEDAPPELRGSLGDLRNLLHSAVERIDGAMDPNPNPPWPGIAARA